MVKIQSLSMPVIKTFSIRMIMLFMVVLFLWPMGVKTQSVSNIDLQQINADLKAASKTGYQNYDREKYLIRSFTLKEEKRELEAFEKTNAYPKGKLMGPFYSDDNEVYFVKKVRNGKTFKCNFYQLGAFQPFGLSDAVFDAEVDRVRQLCSPKRNLSKVMETYESQSDTYFEEVMESGWMNASSLRPEIAAFMEKKGKGKIFLTQKNTINDITFLSLLQKADKNRKVKTVTYLRVDLKSNLPEIEHID